MQASETTWQSGLKWGTIIGVSGFLWVCLEYALGYHTTKIEDHATFTYLYYLILIGIVVLHSRSLGMPILQKNRFQQYLLLSIITALVASLVSVIGMLVFFRFINPAFFQTFQSMAIQFYLSEGKSMEDAQIAAQGYFNENSYLLQGFIGTLFFVPVIYTITWIFRRVLFLKPNK